MAQGATVSRAARPLEFVSTPVGGLVLVGGVVLLASLVGIWSRPAGLLASLWPANAVLLGLFVRVPSLASRTGWLVAAAAFLIADLATGSTLEKTLWLTAANLSGVAVGLAVFGRFKPIDRVLGRPISINFVFLGCVAAAIGSALIGIWANVLVFGGTHAEGAEIWFTSELANYMAFLPVFLAAPSAVYLRRAEWIDAFKAGIKPVVLPAAALVVALVGGLYFPDPAAIALPVPVLLFCALRAGVFATTLLTLITLSWTMVMIGQGVLDLNAVSSGDESNLRSIQICLSLIAMGPIAVACNVDSKERDLAALRIRADLDSMTGALTREAFFERLDRHQRAWSEAGSPIAMLMLDLDHFKNVNDTVGHAGGDAVLTGFGERVQSAIRSNDLFGRVGGEEFAVVLPGIQYEMAKVVAEHLRESCAAAPIAYGGSDLTVTVSVGLAHSGDASVPPADLLLAADKALYRAKHEGRNRVEATAL